MLFFLRLFYGRHLLRSFPNREVGLIIHVLTLVELELGGGNGQSFGGRLGVDGPYNVASPTGSSSDMVAKCSRKHVTRVSTQRPFNLKTQQRGKAKEENPFERLRKM
jgi:hypothetical protein